ncbi:MAG: helix-turn-helix domain-containing protein [Bacillota bacterium]
MTNFGSQLKKLRKANKITQKDLAQALGLAQTTIANYENSSRFPNQETLVKLANHFDVSLDYLIKNEMSQPTSIGKSEQELKKMIKKDPHFQKNEEARKLFLILLDQAKTKAQHDILAQVQNQDDIVKIYTDIFQPVLYKIGDLWSKGIISIDRERYFSNSILELMSWLKQRLDKSTKKDLTILGFAPNTESHYIGLRMAMDIFQIAGWESIYYGNNLPIKNILNSISFHQPDAVAFSITSKGNLNTLLDTIEQIRLNYNSEKLKIIVGGYGAVQLKERYPALEIDAVIDNLAEAVEITEHLISN